MEKKLGQNIVYQTIYQILTIITPLVTAPYISRVLGADGLGEYSFTFTTAYYFVLFAMLGVANYGTRAIAKVQGSKEERSKTFWNIYCLQMTLSIVMSAVYVGYLLIFVKEGLMVYLAQGITIFACLFDVNWYFFGIERFKLTVTRNIIVKLLNIASIFLFVNRNTGVFAYALVVALGTLIGFLVLWPFLKGEISFVRPRWKEMIRHLKPNIILFLPVLATSVFHIMDKTMLGKLASYTQLGYYTNSDKVISIPIGIFTGLGTVYLPRITALRKKESPDILHVITDSLELHSFFIGALAFGLAAISAEFAPLFFGPGYDACADLIVMFAPVLIVKAYSGYVRMIILVPYQKDIRYTEAVCVGAIVNFIINFMLIPRYGAVGAVIGTFAAEFSVCAVQLIKLPVQIGIKNMLLRIFPYLLFGGVMFAVVRAAALVPVKGILQILVEIVLGGAAYMLLCGAFWGIFKNSMFHAIIGKIRGRLHI